MIIAAFINVVLDLVFVAGFNWSVAGAALATVIAQAFSAFTVSLLFVKLKSYIQTGTILQKSQG